MATLDLSLRVGQVIYLCARKETRVYPVLVTEKIVKNTLEGDFTSYVVRLPTRDAKEATLDSIDAEVFTSIDDASKIMMSKAKMQIQKILENAKSLSANAFGHYEVEEPEVQQEAVEESKDETSTEEDFALVELGNGQVAKINLDSIESFGEENE